MLHENHQKIIVEQLGKKRVEVLSRIEIYMRQMAVNGSKLKECLDEVDNIEIVLNQFIDDVDYESDDEE